MSASNLDLVPRVDRLDGGLVIDVGANVGDWTAAVLEVAPAASLIAVEPSEGPREVLLKRFAGDERVTVDARVVADAPGSREFHVTGHSHNSSLRQPRAEADSLYSAPGAWQVVQTVRVDATTVDDLADGRDVALLKIDVQGAEREVLAGASATLRRTAAVLLEVTYVSHYEGDASFALLHDLMLGAGFVLADLSRPFKSAEGAALWSDACYVPRA